MKSKFIHIVGARPNFMKLAPVVKAIMEYQEIEQLIVHTGQHYDKNLSNVFFDQLGIPEPDFNLGVGSDTQAKQTAKIMIALEELLIEQNPDLIIVYGDVNSTLAASLVCSKLGIKIAHVEAGLRSFDNRMPEEINRIITDRLADFLFTPSEDGNENLAKEGVNPEKVFLVGNIMIDTLIDMLSGIKDNHPMKSLNVPEGIKYVLVTLHRPSNVDDPIFLDLIMKNFENLASCILSDTSIIFPIHPRTRKNLSEIGFSSKSENLYLIDPISYKDFLSLQKNAMAIVTDSGGIQEETTYLGIPCLTLRENTERPITIELGTNVLLGKDLEKMNYEISRIVRGDAEKGIIPPLWDGKTGWRIAKILADKFI